ncbi:MAG: lysophospholipid acyltransferase family protein [Gammaproteobacteria bacterium]
MLIIRSALFYLGYVPMTILLSLLFITLFPMLPARGRYNFAAMWCGFVLHWLRISCGVRWQIKGQENLTGQSAVVLANHQSSWETLSFYRLFFPIAPILKKELLRIPFWGWALRLLQPIAIDRSKPRDAGKSILKQGVQRLRDGYSVIIFPEGTRAHVDEVKHFSRGGAKLAVAAGVPIIPIALRTGHCWPPRQFLKYPGVITLEIGEPMATDSGDANALTDAAEQWVRQRVALMSEQD